MRDTRTRSSHLSVYAAIASAVDYVSMSGAIRARRIEDRAHVGKATRRSVVADLEQWGYLKVERRHGEGRPAVFTLLPTSEAPDETSSEERADRLGDPAIAGSLGAARRWGHPGSNPPLSDRGMPNDEVRGSITDKYRGGVDAMAGPDARYPSSELLQNASDSLPARMNEEAEQWATRRMEQMIADGKEVHSPDAYRKKLAENKRQEIAAKVADQTKTEEIETIIDECEHADHHDGRVGCFAIRLVGDGQYTETRQCEWCSSKVQEFLASR
jgi:hypothetical protein